MDVQDAKNKLLIKKKLDEKLSRSIEKILKSSQDNFNSHFETLIKELNKRLDALEKKEYPKPYKSVEVTNFPTPQEYPNEIKILNFPKQEAIEVKNLTDIKIPEPLKEVKVSNFTDKVEVKNLKDIKIPEFKFPEVVDVKEVNNEPSKVSVERDLQGRITRYTEIIDGVKYTYQVYRDENGKITSYARVNV